jgi:uncharacterized repeat protein (TIGR01451 family)
LNKSSKEDEMKTIIFFFSIAIFLSFYIIAQNNIRVVANAPGNQYQSDTDGDYIVYVGEQTGSPQIYLYKISDSTTTQITTAVSYKGNPKISGNTIVWTDARDGNLNYNIYTYHINMPQLGDYVMIDFAGNQYVGALDGEKLVYFDEQTLYSRSVQLYSWNPVFLRELRPPGQGVFSASIDGNLIAYTNGRFIYRYRIDTQETILVSDYLSTKFNVNISGRRIVWEDDRNGNWDIYLFYYNHYNWNHLYDFNFSGRWDWARYRPEKPNQNFPNLSGNQLVFSDNNSQSGRYDIYLFTFYGALSGVRTKIYSSDFDNKGAVVKGDNVVWWDDKTIVPMVSEADVYLWQKPPGADLAIDVFYEPEEIQVGQSVYYTLLVSNLGPSLSTNTMAVDTLSTKLDLQSVSSTAGTINISGRIITCNIGDLPPDSTVKIDIAAIALTEGWAVNKAKVTGDEVDYVLSNNTNNNSLRIRKVRTITNFLLSEGGTPVIKVDDSGKAHILYSGSGALYYATNKNGLWETLQLEDDSIAYFNHDIALDQNNNIHICYGKGDGFSDNKLVYLNNTGGTWSNPQIAVGSAGACLMPKIRIDNSDFIHLAYLTGYWSGSSVIYINNKTGSWISSNISSAYNSMSMDIDSNGFVHIVTYSIDLNGPAYITNSPAGTWQSLQPIETNWGGAQLETLSIDIAVDNTNTPHVSYVGNHNDINENYKYAKKVGSVWQNELVALGEFSGGFNCIAVDNNGVPSIMFIDPYSNELKIATKSGPSFDSIFVWVLPYEPWNRSFDITTDSNNELHFTFAAEGDIRYGTTAAYIVHYGGGDPGSGGYFYANSTSGGSSSPSQPTYEWIYPDSSGHAAINTWTEGNGNDGYFGPVDIGFEFKFFNELYNQVFIGSNGYLTFGDGLTLTADDAIIPSVESPNNIIAACAMDLNLDNSQHPNAKVYYGGNSNEFVVTYLYAYVNNSSTDYITFQVILYPNGNIKYQYNNQLSVQPVPASIANDALIGIENIWGDKGVTYRNNGAGGPIFASPLAVMFGFNNQVLPVEIIESGIITHYCLEQNYPNPFNPSTTIRYSIPEPGRVTIKVYDILGRELITLLSEEQATGTYEAKLNASMLSSGVYFYQLRAGSFIQTKKMILLR